MYPHPDLNPSFFPLEIVRIDLRSRKSSERKQQTTNSKQNKGSAFFFPRSEKGYTINQVDCKPVFF